MTSPTDPNDPHARYLARAHAVLPEGREARWAAIPGAFTALYRRDARLTIGGFQAHAQQGIERLLRALSVRAGSGFVDLDRTLVGVYERFVPAMIAFTEGGSARVTQIASSLPDGVFAAFERIEGGEGSEGNLDLLWTEQPYVQRAFYDPHPVLAWIMTRGARIDFGLGAHRYPRRFDPRASIGRSADRIAWDRELWRAWERAQGEPAQLDRIDEIVARGADAGASYGALWGESGSTTSPPIAR